MQHDLDLYFALLEKRLLLMRALAAELTESQAAVVEMDIKRVEQHTASQEQLCLQLRHTERDLNDCQLYLSSAGSGKNIIELSRLTLSSRQRLNALHADLWAAQSEVRQLGQVHAALLRRSQQSIKVLQNVFASYAATYAETHSLTGLEPAHVQPI